MSLLAWRSRSNGLILSRHLKCRFQSTTSSKKSTSFILVGIPTLLVTGYAGGAYHASRDESFKHYWLQYAPMASESLDWIEILTKQDFSKSTEEAVSQVGTSWNEAAAVVKGYVDTVTSAAQQGYHKSVEWIENSKENVDLALQTVSDKSSNVKKVLEQAKVSVEEASHVVTETVTSVVDAVNGNTPPEKKKNEIKVPVLKVDPDTAANPVVEVTPLIVEAPLKPVQVAEEPVQHTTDALEESQNPVPMQESPEVSTLNLNTTDMLAITHVVDQLPQESIARHLAESLSQLAFILGDLLSGVQNGKLILDEHAMKKVVQARNDLISASERLSGLQIEEATLIAQALEEQGDKFYAIVENQMLLHKQELEKQASDMKESFDEAITKTKQELASQHQKEMVEMLADQASMLLTEFDNEMKKQAQNIDRRWEKEVKKRLDEEREGRLARLDHLALKLKLLEKMNITVGEAVDRGHQMQTLWASVRALKDVLENNVHSLPFKQELTVLRKAAEQHSYPIVKQVVDTISDDAAAFGIPTLVEIQSRFQSVAKAMRKAQFMPREGGGPLSYTLSIALSNMVFKKTGCVPGEDVEAVLARAEYFLEKGDVDSAARHMNQIKGTVGRLSRDWMTMARHYLHLRQAIEIIETHLELMDLNVL